MDNGFPFDVILLAMIAAFIVLRLRNVLGRRTGHERRRHDPYSAPPGEEAGEQPEPGSEAVVQLPGRSRAGTAEAARDEGTEGGPATQLAATLAQIKMADATFDEDRFLSGARTAFEDVVGAFAAGDTDKLKPLLSEEVYDNFASAIKARKAAKEVLETNLLGFRGAEILEAHMEGHAAYVTVKFVTEQINVTLGEAGNVVGGDGDQITRVTDIWTFGRDTRSRDLNWLLVSTETPQ